MTFQLQQHSTIKFVISTIILFNNIVHTESLGLGTYTAHDWLTLTADRDGETDSVLDLSRN